MWIALAVLAALVIAALVLLLRSDGRFQVRRSQEMKVPAEKIFSVVADFRSWPLWSPWLMHEPDSEVVYSDNCRQQGGHYSWNGQRIGAGKMTHVSLTPDSRIEQRLEITRPFRSTSRVDWEFESRDDSTLVSWEMSGRMPFLLRFMAARMEPMIGRDYELGLALLNGYLDEKAPHPKLDFIGTEKLEDFSYWAMPCNGNLRQLEAARQPAIESLIAAADGKTGLPLTLYHRFDPLDTLYRAEIAIPIDLSTPESNYTRREFSGGLYFKMILRGDHRFVPLGWYALHNHCRMHRHKPDRARPALEIYQVEPGQADDSNRVETALYLPIKG
jgi:ribosome-associated toxin RatA of RatAB toxin-antitoxin module